VLYGGIDSREKPLDLSPVEEEESLIAKEPVDTQTLVQEVETGYAPMSQYEGQYILVPVKSGLMWVHQRRAHIRVLFEKYRSQISEQHGASQGLLFPERMELSIAEALMLEAISDEVVSLGFDVSSLGGNTFVLNGIPAGIEGLSPVKLLTDIIQSAMEQAGDVKEKVRERIAVTMAKEVAIVTGQLLSQEEMTTLVNELFGTTMPSHTPDGKPVIYIMNDNEIDRNFVK
jgi:DNA mismatch repair protein MutL